MAIRSWVWSSLLHFLSFGHPKYEEPPEMFSWADPEANYHWVIGTGLKKPV